MASTGTLSPKSKLVQSPFGLHHVRKSPPLLTPRWNHRRYNSLGIIFHSGHLETHFRNELCFRGRRTRLARCFLAHISSRRSTLIMRTMALFPPSTCLRDIKANPLQLPARVTEALPLLQVKCVRPPRAIHHVRITNRRSLVTKPQSRLKGLPSPTTMHRTRAIRVEAKVPLRQVIAISLSRRPMPSSTAIHPPTMRNYLARLLHTVGLPLLSPRCHWSQ
jgi:hypothetical protein